MWRKRNLRESSGSATDLRAAAAAAPGTVAEGKQPDRPIPGRSMRKGRIVGCSRDFVGAAAALDYMLPATTPCSALVDNHSYFHLLGRLAAGQMSSWAGTGSGIVGRSPAAEDILGSGKPGTAAAAAERGVAVG